MVGVLMNVVLEMKTKSVGGGVLKITEPFAFFVI